MVAEYKRAELTKTDMPGDAGRRPARAAPQAARCGPAYRGTVLTRLVSGHGPPSTTEQTRGRHPGINPGVGHAWMTAQAGHNAPRLMPRHTRNGAHVS